MRKLTRKQLLARLFAGFFAIGSMLCTVNSAVAEEPSETYGKYYYNNEPSEFPFDNLNEIKKPDSNNNISLTITGPNSPAPDIYSGFTDSCGDIKNNILKITTNEGVATKLSNVYGGYTNNGDATQNIIDIAGSTINGDVYGGKVGTADEGKGDAVSNTIIINNSIASDSIFYGGYACNGDANSNTVEITNSKAGTVWGGYIKSKSAIGNANSNTLKLTDSEVSGHIVAAYNQGTGDAVENTIEINGGTIGSEDTLIAGAYVATGSAILNKVTLSGCSSVTCEQISGGYVNNDGDATNNTVKLSGASIVSGSVYGGFVDKTGNATNNTIEISGASTVSGSVYGGKVNGTGDTNDAKTGNKLIIASADNIIGGQILNFETMTFDAADVKKDETMLSLTTESPFTIGVKSIETNNADLAVGEKIILISSAVNNKYDGSITYKIDGKQATDDGSGLRHYIDSATEDADKIVHVDELAYVKEDNNLNLCKTTGFITGLYNGFDAEGAKTLGQAEMTISSVPQDVNMVYGAYSEDEEVKAGGVTVNLETTELSDVNLIGSYNDAAPSLVDTANNTLNVNVSGVKVNSVDGFGNMNFKLASDENAMLEVKVSDGFVMNGMNFNSILPEDGLEGTKTIIKVNNINADGAKFTINNSENKVSIDEAMTTITSNGDNVIYGTYKYTTNGESIALTGKSIVGAVIIAPGETKTADDKTLKLTNSLAEKYTELYGAFNADGGDATGATVELSEAVSNENLTIYGGYSTGSGVDVTTDNTLEVAKSGNKLKNILNFEKINFFTDSANNQSMLTLATDTVDLSNTYINVQFGDAPLADGQTVTLLDTKQLSLSDKKLRINDKTLDANMSLKLAAYGSDNKYVNVGDYSMKSDDTKLSITAKESFLTSKYTNGNESLSVEKFVLTDELNKFKAIYGSYSADNSAAEGGKLSISQKVDLSKTTLIGGKSAGNGEVKNNTLEISSAAAGSKVKGAEKFDNFKFTLASGMSGSTPMLSTTDKILLDGATIDTDLSNLDAADDTKLVLLDNTEGKAAKRLLNGKEGNIINAKKNEGFVAISSVGYSADEDKLAIDVKSEGAAGCFIDENGNLIGNGNKVLTLGSSAASNMRAGYERASSAPDISECENIYGIYSEGDNEASGGVVQIISPIQFNNCKIHGGYSTKRGYWSKGNTLKVDTLNARVRAITHFENMEFNLPSETRNGSIMLTVADSLDLEPTKKITVNASKATNNLKVGDKVRLINCEGGIKHFSKQEKIIKGLTDKISDIALERSSLNLLIKGEQQNNNTKAPVEAISATTALVNYTSELAAGKLNRNMVMAVDVSRIDAAKDNSENNSNIKTVPVKTDFATFAALGGGNLTYNTGSYVKSDSWNVGFGIGKKGMSSKNPDATYGLFFQYGKSNFSTHNDGGYRGDGDSKMFGAGLMFHQEANSKYYYQGSISAGKVDADWSCKDGSYDDKATYYSMTFGMGHKHNVGGNKTMDVYGRYSFNHVGSMEGDLNGNKYDFDSTNGHNLRLGFRMEYDRENAAIAYWGLAWEHEFAGASGATLTTPNIVERTASPSLKGDSGIAEVGYQWKRGNWEYNINAEGSFGKREGVTGSFNINYNF